MSHIEDLTQATFKSRVVDNDKPVLVDFWASWCKPCLAMQPVLESVAEKLQDRALVAKVNVDEERVLGAMFQIMSIPALLVFKDGKKVAEFSGVQSEALLVEKLESLL